MRATSENHTPDPHPSDAGDRLAAAMAADWAHGDCQPAEHYLALLPDTPEAADGAVRLIYEEVCLRGERGEEPTAEELARRFPRWGEELAVMLDCHRLVEARMAPPTFPVPGESLGEFRLVSELGRGAHGRVFLATQPSLAGRSVVLKVTPRQDREFLSLARLQHTHIIPLLGAYDFPTRNLRGLCQPYLGGTSLAHLLEAVQELPRKQWSGAALVNALDTACEGSSLPTPRGGPRAILSRLPWAEAICWTAACLADGLQYAHERGLVHLDLKPSNVLLAADGQPLLLDFHLARHPIEAGQPAPGDMGGTLYYMSPEQRAAFGAGELRLPVPKAVDGRSDIYSLGRLLLGALGGDDCMSPARLERDLPGVSAGLADIVRRCLEPDPENRYPDAGSVAADLRRHLADLPLRGVPNRSLAERWRKWRRRKPHAPLWAGLVLALAGVPALLGAAVLERFRGADEALVEGQIQFRQGEFAEASRTLSRGKARIAWLPGSADLVGELDAWGDRARQADAAERLHLVCEQLRLVVVGNLTRRELESLDEHCRAAWGIRHFVARDGSGPAAEDLADLALLRVDLKRRLADDGAEPDGVAELLAEAERLRGLPVPVAAETGTFAPAPGEQVRLGRTLMTAGKLDRAARELEAATDLRPQDFWAHFYRGVCAYRRGRHAEAVHSFDVAVALAPQRAAVYHNRALAHVALGDVVAARRDYDRALEREPTLAAAAMNRGILHLKTGRLDDSMADLEQALHDGADPATVHYNLALVHLARGETALAGESVRRALTHSPDHVSARRLGEQLRNNK